MRISTRGRYALGAMVDVALYSGNGPVSRQDIAERQEMSADYVVQLLWHLQGAGMVEGVKGAGDWFRLARHGGAIRAGNVVRAANAPTAVVHDNSPCRHGVPGHRDGSGTVPCAQADSRWRGSSGGAHIELSGRSAAEIIDSGCLPAG